MHKRSEGDGAALAASATGIFVSSLVRNADRAMTIAPLLLMPQLLFSGLIFTLTGASKVLSWIAACRFSMEAFGTTANLNSLTMKLAQQGLPIQHPAEDFYTFSAQHFTTALGVLCAFCLVFSVAAGIALRGIRTEQK
ncbi:MAG: ABC transporter permease [Propionibacteriaceae bacterium]|nr:ABC transporter permease [Propionibacteriaceae bacterium]